MLVLLRYRAELDAGDAWLWLYVALLATLVPTGAYGWWAARRAPADEELVAAPGGRSAGRT